jgi:F-type H+-transporting ATPase subunit b
MEIVRQLGELFLQAVPTVLIVFAFYLFLRWQFFGPLERVLREREERTGGTMRAAEAEESAARGKAREYQERLKEARAAIYAEHDAGRRKLLEEREERIREARDRARDEVRLAKERIEADAAAARRQLERAETLLASEIVRVILQRRPTPPAGEAR